VKVPHRQFLGWRVKTYTGHYVQRLPESRPGHGVPWLVTNQKPEPIPKPEAFRLAAVFIEAGGRDDMKFVRVYVNTHIEI